MQPLGGAREVELLGDRQEVTQLAELEDVQAGDGIGSLVHQPRSYEWRLTPERPANIVGGSQGRDREGGPQR